jgi:glycerol-1-phosphate dehydrogenase [NAD(P)+]
MSDLLFRRYLDRLGPEGGFPCSCGRVHRIRTRHVLVGRRVLEELPALLRERHGPRVRVWLVSDQNTERAAGERCRELLGRWPLSGTTLPANPKPNPTLELAAELRREAAGSSPGLVLAVGAGVISDLGKKVAHELGIPSWCVATAPSVDAFTSDHSVFKSRASHQSISVTPSEAVFCELPVLAAAPPKLLLAGLGDLLGKFVAYLDWNLSALLTGEYLCAETVRIARESALRPLEALEHGQGPGEALLPLTDALLTTGFLMQAMDCSRPASSAEHTAAHIWELAGVVGNAELNLHGLLVGLASRMVLEAYQVFYDRLPVLEANGSLQARLEALASEPPWERQIEPELALFAEHIRNEMSGAELGRKALERRLQAYGRERERIAGLARQSLADLQRGVSALQAIGYPFTQASFGLSPAHAYLPFSGIRFLRNRYNTFWLMHELGEDQKPLEALRALASSP